MPPKETGSSSGSSARSRPASLKKEVKAEPIGDASASSTPTVETTEPYRDIPLISSDLAGWTYHLMKFAHHMPVAPTNEEQFVPPLRLNRKRPPRAKQPPAKGGEPVTDRFNKPVLDVEGQPLVWPRSEEEIEKVKETFKMMEAQKNKGADISLIAPGGSGRAQKTRLFAPRVKEVHKSSTAARKTMLAEYQPWVLEDYETDNHWESAMAPRPNGVEALEKALRNGSLQRSIDIARAAQEAERADAEMADGFTGKVKAEPQEPTQIRMEQSGRDHAPWIGKLEGDSENKTAGHALFVLDNSHADGCFKYIPVRNMYRFDQKPAHSVFTADEAEKQFELMQKSRGSNRFMMRNIRGDTDVATPIPLAYKRESLASGSGARGSNNVVVPGRQPIKSEVRRSHSNILDRLSSARSSSSSSRGGGLRGQLRAVVGFKKEEEDEGGRRRDEDSGAIDELDYQEDFADDEEKMEGDNMGGEEEETREMEERLKREIARAEQEAEDGEEDEDDAAVAGHGTREDDVLTGSGRQMKKIMKAFAWRDGNEAYESDEEKNPYASDESDNDEPALANPEEAMRKIKEDKERREAELAASASALSGPSATGSRPTSQPGSRASTPSGRAEKHPLTNGKTAAGVNQRPSPHRPGSGHASVAQRATSPGPRGPRSTARSRSGSPAASGSGSGSGAGGSQSLKRKSDHVAEGSSAAASGSSPGGHAAAAASTAEGSKRPRLNTASGSTRNSAPSSPGPASPSAGSPTSAGGARQPESEMEAELIRLVSSGRGHTMRDLVQEFRLAIRQDPEVKAQLLVAVGRVLMNDRATGRLRVKDGFLA